MSDSSSIGLRVGILGAASITWQVWDAIVAAGGKVTYVGCRDTARGTAFAKELCQFMQIPDDQAPQVGSYDEVIESKTVDLVYIPLPTSKRHEWVLKCAQHNKHVVGEKPTANSAEEVRQWVEELDRRQLLFVDGTMFSHSRRIQEIQKTVHQIGAPIKFITTHFTFNGGEDFIGKDIRLDPSLEPQGCLGDVGWYCTRFILHLVEERMPTEVSGRVLKRDGKHQGITQFSGELLFRDVDEDGKVLNTTLATIFCGFDTSFQNSAVVYTPEKSIQVKDFAHPTQCDEHAAYYRVVQDLSGNPKPTDFVAWREEETFTVPNETTRTQRVDMWKHIAETLVPEGEGEERVLKAKAEEARHYATLTWKTQAVLDKLLESALQAEKVASA